MQLKISFLQKAVDMSKYNFVAVDSNKVLLEEKASQDFVIFGGTLSDEMFIADSIHQASSAIEAYISYSEMIQQQNIKKFTNFIQKRSV